MRCRTGQCCSLARWCKCSWHWPLRLSKVALVWCCWRWLAGETRQHSISQGRQQKGQRADQNCKKEDGSTRMREFVQSYARNGHQKVHITLPYEPSMLQPPTTLGAAVPVSLDKSSPSISMLTFHVDGGAPAGRSQEASYFSQASSSRGFQGWVLLCDICLLASGLWQR